VKYVSTLGRWRSITVLFLLLLLLFLRGLLQPELVSVRFGAPLSDATATLFFRVHLSRNMALICLGAIFLALDARLPFETDMTSQRYRAKASASAA
jgi:hypothetical protein